MDRYGRLHRVAASQAGVWTRDQARACGFADSRIDRLVAGGAWVRWFDGPVLTAAGTPASWEVTLTAACLRVGEDAVVARRSAARLWRLPDFDAGEAIELVVPRGHTPDIAGITVRRTTWLEDHEVVRFGHHRVTSVTRTLHDLAGVTDDRTLLLAAAEGYRLGRTDPLRLIASVHARPRLPGNPRVRRVLEQLDDRFRRTRAVSEIVGIVVLDDLGVTGYRVNVRLELTSGRRVEVDVLLDGRGVLEINGERYHGDVLRRRADRQRRAELEADGYEVAELWVHELTDRARVREVVDDLRARVAARTGAVVLRVPDVTVSTSTTGST
ncbi:MAG: hypothetical protein KY457_12925 [Actinobacteria bacterium]|nr:hypothetical protein [Actinomycetota bacterium]